MSILSKAGACRPLMAGAFFAAALAFGPAAHAETKDLILTTQSVGTSVFARAGVFKDVIDQILPEGYTLEVQPSSSGGAASALLVEVGKAQLGTSNNVPAKQLLEGRYDPNRAPLKNVASIVGGTDFTYMTIMFTDSFVQKTGIKTLEELIEKKHPARIVTKAPGSFGMLGATDLLDVLGSKFEDVKSWGGDVYHIDPNQMVDMLKEGRADVSIDVVSLGQPAFSELTLTTKMHVIELAPETRSALIGYGYANKVTPAKSWGGQDNEVKTVAGTEVLIVNKDAPEDLVYAITKALSENKALMVERVPAMAAFDPAEGGNIEYLGVPLHPGAERYFREAGLLK